MKKERTMNNKGFSLVELIIVIAIMAILIGVMAPQLTKYVERTRQSADMQVADSVRTAVVTTLLDPAVTDGPTGAVTSTDIAATPFTGSTAFATSVAEILGDTPANVKAKLKSDAYKGQDILVSVTADKQVTVTINANSGTGASAIVVK